MSDVSAAPAATRSLTWATFAHVASESAKEYREPSVIKGIINLGPEYSLGNDDELDSLGIVEIIMNLEERLEVRLGKPFKLPDQLEDKAANLGEAYLLICKENGVEFDPDFSKTPDLSSFSDWLGEQAKKKAN